MGARSGTPCLHGGRGAWGFGRRGIPGAPKERKGPPGCRRQQEPPGRDEELVPWVKEAWGAEGRLVFGVSSDSLQMAQKVRHAGWQLLRQ